MLNKNIILFSTATARAKPTSSAVSPGAAVSTAASTTAAAITSTSDNAQHVIEKEIESRFRVEADEVKTAAIAASKSDEFALVDDLKTSDGGNISPKLEKRMSSHTQTQFVHEWDICTSLKEESPIFTECC